MKFLIIVFSLIILSCASQVEYTHKSDITREESLKIIEQVVYEQPQKYRPEYVQITDEYIGYGSGTVSRHSGSNVGVHVTNDVSVAKSKGKSKTKYISKRVYFNSIGKVNLFKKRKWFSVQIISTDGYQLDQIFTRNETKARRLIDAIYFLKNNKPN